MSSYVALIFQVITQQVFFFFSSSELTESALGKINTWLHDCNIKNGTSKQKAKTDKGKVLFLESGIKNVYLSMGFQSLTDYPSPFFPS